MFTTEYISIRESLANDNSAIKKKSLKSRVITVAEHSDGHHLAAFLQGRIKVGGGPGAKYLVGVLGNLILLLLHSAIIIGED